MTEGTNADHPFRSERGRRATYRGLAAATAEKLTSPVHAAIFGAGLAIALLRHAPRPAASAVAREVRA
jgi:hypothetical protein